MHARLVEEAGATSLVLATVDPGAMALLKDGNLSNIKIPILLVNKNKNKKKIK